MTSFLAAFVAPETLWQSQLAILRRRHGLWLLCAVYRACHWIKHLACGAVRNQPETSAAATISRNWAYRNDICRADDGGKYVKTLQALLPTAALGGDFHSPPSLNTNGSSNLLDLAGSPHATTLRSCDRGCSQLHFMQTVTHYLLSRTRYASWTRGRTLSPGNVRSRRHGRGRRP